MEGRQVPLQGKNHKLVALFFCQCAEPLHLPTVEIGLQNQGGVERSQLLKEEQQQVYGGVGQAQVVLTVDKGEGVAHDLLEGVFVENGQAVPFPQHMGEGGFSSGHVPGDKQKFIHSKSIILSWMRNRFSSVYPFIPL